MFGISCAQFFFHSAEQKKNKLSAENEPAMANKYLLSIENGAKFAIIKNDVYQTTSDIR